ncbi:MAG: YaiI/YqxD family protein [Candidatus Hydrogenedentes bacterium]|nr:YaiI/YqxD family protein [Candidatus Hydrogenedentota bacterium]
MTQSIYVDADGCPVKDEVYKVARRYGWRVFLVANKSMFHPSEDFVEMVLVDDGFDAADNWIAEHAGPQDVVITADIPLAGRCLERGARVLGVKGRVFTEEGIGGALAQREFSSQMREHGMNTGGPAPFGPKDRSRFLQALDTAIQACLREVRP